MASLGQQQPAPALTPWAEVLTETRQRTLSLVQQLSDEQLQAVHSELLSPLVWDLGHVASFEDLWISRTFGEEPLRADLIAVYDADETPRALRGTLDVLNRRQALSHLEAVQERTLQLLRDIDGANSDLVELVIRHEQQHNETMLQALQLAHLPSPFAATGNGGSAQTSSPVSGLELVEIPGASARIGARYDDGFAYDNEKPRHSVEIPAFLIGKAPVTNADWLEFIERGGYSRAEWWSAQGWQWREQEKAAAPLSWTEGHQNWVFDQVLELELSAPVVHVSWFEADAFARSCDARLPTEFEWEFAATWDPAAGSQTLNPWGEAPVSRELANVDQLGGRPAPAGSFAAGDSPAGLSVMIGDVWEWTSSTFGGYPEFVAYPYREYSEQFFDAGYPVLRGGSWATRCRVASARFRNWDLPQRRQIFSGLRIAKDVQ